MSASLLNTLKKLPAPLFGTAATAVSFSARKASSIPRYAPWALPATLGGLWFVWPAVDEEWKQSMGFSSPPASAAPPAPAEKEEEKVELSPAQMEKVEKAYIVEEVELTEEEKVVMAAVAKGDFRLLEKDWEEFTVKAMNPEDDDDDDDDDDDEDDDDEDEDDE